MKKTLIILLASAALTTIVGLPALAAISASDGTGSHALPAVFERLASTPLPMQVADSDEHHGAWDDDDDDDHGYGHDDEDDDCEDDNHMAVCASGANPAPAGTTAPPQNGLFANGASPAVQVN